MRNIFRAFGSNIWLKHLAQTIWLKCSLETLVSAAIAQNLTINEWIDPKSMSNRFLLARFKYSWHFALKRAFCACSSWKNTGSRKSSVMSHFKLLKPEEESFTEIASRHFYECQVR